MLRLHLETLAKSDVWAEFGGDVASLQIQRLLWPPILSIDGLCTYTKLSTNTSIIKIKPQRARWSSGIPVCTSDIMKGINYSREAMYLSSNALSTEPGANADEFIVRSGHLNDALELLKSGFIIARQSPVSKRFMYKSGLFYGPYRPSTDPAIFACVNNPLGFIEFFQSNDPEEVARELSNGTIDAVCPTMYGICMTPTPHSFQKSNLTLYLEVTRTTNSNVSSQKATLEQGPITEAKTPPRGLYEWVDNWKSRILKTIGSDRTYAIRYSNDFPNDYFASQALDHLSQHGLVCTSHVTGEYRGMDKLPHPKGTVITLRIGWQLEFTESNERYIPMVKLKSVRCVGPKAEGLYLNPFGSFMIKQGLN